MVHGLLHLLGNKDGNEVEKLEMRKMENNYLDLYRNFKDEVLK
jgi:ssRNA-specific RNase YbeY (16S rRNA maturation enzyme)